MIERFFKMLTIIFLASHAVCALSQERPQAPAIASTGIVGMSPKVDAYSLAGLRIGMSEQDASLMFPQLTFKDRGPIRQAGGFVRIPELGNDLLPEAKGEAILELTVLEGRLVNISVRWLPIAFDAMFASLRRELGEPVSAESTQNMAQSGERFTNTVALWVGERAVVRYFQRFENIKQSRLLVMERPAK
ncbi:hypothetical protein [Pseudoduganella sp. OTU4001]|uniref:hypothetical protein n=1 Tax=Pseudoduganella sp. OTU4001 TaxID=3043854 RepID=UPI00313F064A